MCAPSSVWCLQNMVVLIASVADGALSMQIQTIDIASRSLYRQPYERVRVRVRTTRLECTSPSILIPAVDHACCCMYVVYAGTCGHIWPMLACMHRWLLASCRRWAPPSWPVAARCSQRSTTLTLHQVDSGWKVWHDVVHGQDTIHLVQTCILIQCGMTSLH